MGHDPSNESERSRLRLRRFQCLVVRHEARVMNSPGPNQRVVQAKPLSLGHAPCVEDLASGAQRGLASSRPEPHVLLAHTSVGVSP